jgi:hypothetical protein
MKNIITTELNNIEVLPDFIKYLSVYNYDDLYLILDCLLPEGTDIDLAVKEVMEWKN